MFLRTAIAVALIALIGYGVMEAMPLILGPRITITSPVDGQSVPDGILTVAGTAQHVTALSLDGAPLLPDADGRFSRVITLPRGGAILTLTATDRFGREITKRASVFVP